MNFFHTDQSWKQLEKNVEENFTDFFSFSGYAESTNFGIFFYEVSQEEIISQNKMIFFCGGRIDTEV